MESKADQFIYRAFFVVLGLICLLFFFKFAIDRGIADFYFPDKPHPIKWKEMIFGLSGIVCIIEAFFMIIWNKIKNLRKAK
jgi:hypothetical protein